MSATAIVDSIAEFGHARSVYGVAAFERTRLRHRGGAHVERARDVSADMDIYFRPETVASR